MELKLQLDQLNQSLLVNAERLPKMQRKVFLEKALREGWHRREIVRRVEVLDAKLRSRMEGRTGKPLELSVLEALLAALDK